MEYFKFKINISEEDKPCFVDISETFTFPSFIYLQHKVVLFTFEKETQKKIRSWRNTEWAWMFFTRLEMQGFFYYLLNWTWNTQVVTRPPLTFYFIWLKSITRRSGQHLYIENDTTLSEERSNVVFHLIERWMIESLYWSQACNHQSKFVWLVAPAVVNNSLWAGEVTTATILQSQHQHQPIEFSTNQLNKWFQPCRPCQSYWSKSKFIEVPALPRQYCIANYWESLDKVQLSELGLIKCILCLVGYMKSKVKDLIWKRKR